MTLSTDIMLASKVVFNIAQGVQHFNEKARRMDNPDYDFNEILANIVYQLDRRELSPDLAAAKFVSGWIKSRSNSNDVAVLRDAYTTLYITLQQKLDPWLVTPDVRVIFERYDFTNGDFVINFA